MKTTLSRKGQVTIPIAIRRKLGLRPGDPLDVTVEDARIVLTPRRERKKKVRILTDPVTRLPVLSAGPNAPRLTSKQVARSLADFP
jgi:AbrB family looped-hinge helix DNA binding protein